MFEKILMEWLTLLLEKAKRKSFDTLALLTVLAGFAWYTVGEMRDLKTEYEGRFQTLAKQVEIANKNFQECDKDRIAQSLQIRDQGAEIYDLRSQIKALVRLLKR